MDGIGDISAYHGDIFLGALKSQILVTRENDGLESKMVFDYGFEALYRYASPVNAAVYDDGATGDSEDNVASYLFERWVTTIARLCIGARRLGTGGAFLFTQRPLKRRLSIGHSFAYSRLRDATVLRVVDDARVALLRDIRGQFIRDASVPSDLVVDLLMAEADAEDRESETTGAVKLVTSLAAVDGLVLMKPDLSVLGFGVKIGGGPNLPAIYDGASYARRGRRARKIEPAHFGTRHGSMLRYCAQDRRAMGIVVSQDGYVRLIMSAGTDLVMWDNIKLLGHTNYTKAAVSRLKRYRSRPRHPFKLGFTSMPKTIDALLRRRPKQKRTNP